MPLFEVIVLEHPSKAEAEAGELEKLIFGPKAVIAKNEKIAGVKALMGEADKVPFTDRSEVVVRPFA